MFFGVSVACGITAKAVPLGDVFDVFPKDPTEQYDGDGDNAVADADGFADAADDHSARSR